MLRVPDAGPDGRCHGHRGRRPEACREGTRGRWGVAVPLSLWGFRLGTGLGGDRRSEAGRCRHRIGTGRLGCSIARIGIARCSRVPHSDQWACVGDAGRRPAVSIGVPVGLDGGRHDVSILMTGGRGRRPVCGRLSAPEGLDDRQARAAAWAWRRIGSGCVVGRPMSVGGGLRRRDAEQLACPCDVLGALAGWRTGRNDGCGGSPSAARGGGSGG